MLLPSSFLPATLFISDRLGEQIEATATLNTLETQGTECVTHVGRASKLGASDDDDGNKEKTRTMVALRVCVFGVCVLRVEVPRADVLLLLHFLARLRK